jgi:predicted nucleic acid-binding protein
MIVLDTSALISLATADALSLVTREFDSCTTDLVLEELESTAEYDDVHGRAACEVLDERKRLSVHETAEPAFESSRVDAGEGSCVALVREHDADFLVTDDFRALPELRNLVDAQVAISPILLKALEKRGVLDRADARNRVERLAENRDWLGTPIYRRARALFEE